MPQSLSKVVNIIVQISVPALTISIEHTLATHLASFGRQRFAPGTISPSSALVVNTPGAKAFRDLNYPSGGDKRLELNNT